MPCDYPSQNAGKPTNVGAEKWRRSFAASPQTAGIPTAFNDNERELGREEPDSPVDLTGGVMEYRRKQAKVSE